MTWPELLDRFGVSIAVLVVFSGAVAVACVAVWRWVTPRIDKLLDSHLSFISHVHDAVSALVDLAKRNDDRLDRMERGLSPPPTQADFAVIEEKLAELKRIVGGTGEPK